MSSISLVSMLLNMLSGGDEEQPRIHIDESGGHEKIAREVMDVIERNVRESNPGMDDVQFCEECIANVGAITILMAVSRAKRNGRGLMYQAALLDRASKKMSATLIMAMNEEEGGIDRALNIAIGVEKPRIASEDGHG